MLETFLVPVSLVCAMVILIYGSAYIIVTLCSALTRSPVSLRGPNKEHVDGTAAVFGLFSLLALMPIAAFVMDNGTDPVESTVARALWLLLRVQAFGCGGLFFFATVVCLVRALATGLLPWSKEDGGKKDDVSTATAHVPDGSYSKASKAL